MRGTAMRMLNAGIAGVALLVMMVGCAGPMQGEPATSTMLEATSIPAAAMSQVTNSPAASPSPEPSISPTPAPTPSATIEPTATVAEPTWTPRPPEPTVVPPESKAPTATLEAATATQPAVAPEPARYIFPIQPPAGVSYPACHHDYPASDLFTPTGSRFVAVTSGVIDYVSYEDVWDPVIDDPATRGGISVALIGDDGVRYYGSHLSAVADGIVVGRRVSAGELLGLTGNTGSARPTDPHLHFGISHPTRPDDWTPRRGEINPYPYLNAWRDGLNQTPDLTDVGGGVC